MYAPGSTFTIGKGNVLREGSDITLIANGIMVAEALEAARQLEQEGVSAAVIDMFTLKPIDRMLVKNYAEKTGRIVTCENHSIHNGLGSAVAEVLVETCPVPMHRHRAGLHQHFRHRRAQPVVNAVVFAGHDPPGFLGVVFHQHPVDGLQGKHVYHCRANALLLKLTGRFQRFGHHNAVGNQGNVASFAQHIAFADGKR